MATVRLLVPRLSDADVALPGVHQKATIVGDIYRRGNELGITVPYIDAAGDLSDLARDWVEQARPGDSKPLTRAGSPKLTKVSLTLLFADPTDTQAPVERELGTLKALAASDQPVIVAYGGFLADVAWTRSGRWVIRNLDIHVQARAHVDNAITKAEATVDLLEANIPGWSPVATVTRLVQGASGNAGAGVPSTVTVRDGDSLWSIAGRVYSDPTRWLDLGKANQIQDPRRLTVGQVLRVP